MQWRGRNRRAEKARNHRVVTNERGALQLPLALGVLVALTALAGTTALMNQWRTLTAHQLRLDQCVGKVASEFRDLMLKVETINVEMKAIRASLHATRLFPLVYIVAKPLGLAALTVLDTRIRLAQIQWIGRQGVWIAQMGCGKWGDLARPLPGFQWSPGFPDDLGPRPWSWPIGVEKDFKIQVSHRSWSGTRSAAARVDGKNPGFRNWEARWIVPGKF